MRALHRIFLYRFHRGGYGMASSVLDDNDRPHTEQPGKQPSWRRYIWDYWDKSPEVLGGFNFVKDTLLT